jgi:hypothetical protein
MSFIPLMALGFIFSVYANVDVVRITEQDGQRAGPTDVDGAAAAAQLKEQAAPGCIGNLSPAIAEKRHGQPDIVTAGSRRYHLPRDRR